MIARTGALALFVFAIGCSSTSQGKSATLAAADKAFTVLVTTEIKGQIEPCGCTSEPLGDLARTAALVADARKSGAVLVVDGGSLSFTELAPSDDQRGQELLKSQLITKVFTGELGAEAVGLGPYDLAAGAGKVAPARHAANVPATQGVATKAPEVVTIGDVRVGIFGVVAPSLVTPHGVEATDPTAAAAAAIKKLRADGARVVLALLHMDRAAATNLASAVPGIDFAVIGAGAPEKPEDVKLAPAQVGNTWLFQPADRGQVVSRLDIRVRGDGAFADAIGPARAERRIKELQEAIARFDQDLARFESDPSADQAFLARQRAERDALAAERDRLTKSPIAVPDKESWFTLTQIEVKKSLPCNATVQAAKVEYDAAAGKANLASSRGKPIPAPEAGVSGYAGVEECDFCHEEAVAFWKTTNHAHAWETIEKVGKQYNLECISCHVTGFGKPGGSSVASNEKLRNVQCEICHGPASRHVDQNGGVRDSLIKTPTEATCVSCHNELHSDTFQFEAYLRDVTGPGHGADYRVKLGDGPTGRELRSAALNKAGATVGAGCPK